MPVLKIILFTLASLLTQYASALDIKDLLPPDQAFRLSVEAESKDTLLLNWKIAEGYYLYQDKVQIESKTPKITLGQPEFPAGKIKEDPYFGKMETYLHDLNIPVPLNNPSGVSELELLIKYQGCAEIGVCYPPQKKILAIALPIGPPSVDPIDRFTQELMGFKNSLFAPDLLPAEQAFQFYASVVDAQTIKVQWNIAEDYYLYREKIALNLPDQTHASLSSYTIPRGIPEQDEAFGKVEIFYNELEFTVPVIRKSKSPQSITLLAKYQGCAVRGVCYPPMQKSVELQLPAIDKLPVLSTNFSPDSVLSEQDRVAESLQKDTFLLTLLSFFGFGLLLAFTPCIFPMIPILSGIIIGQGNHVTTTRGFMLSLSFVLASAITYTIFGIAAALFGSNLQATFQEPWVIVLFSSIFILLALSMFGFYNLELPKFLQSKLHDASDKQRNGSLLGAGIMGALSSLIVGPCVAAPLAGALIYIGQSGDALLGGSALFMMGLGMGVPLLVLGASAGKLLPKAGHWLYATKAIFGVIMLAVSVWMLDRILPAPVTMFLWAILLIVPAIYLSAIDPLPENTSNWRKLWKGCGLISLVYGILLLIGLGMGNSNPLLPLQGNGLAIAEKNGVIFERIASIQDLDEKIHQASLNNQWVMLDFYADWCISCKEMEAFTFTDPQVKQRLSDFVLIQADVTRNSAEDKALLKKFKLVGPPAILFFGPDTKENLNLRVIGYQDAENFLNTLNKTRI